MVLFKQYDDSPRFSRKTNWKEDRYFRYFKFVIVFLAAFLMLVSIFRKPVPYEKPGMVMIFSETVRKNMDKFALKVPLYSEPSKTSTVIKYYSNSRETFIFLERAKGAWIKVIDSQKDTGWISSYFLRQKPGAK